MRQSIKAFVKLCAETLPIFEPIYEFGSLQVPGQERFADLRPFFQDKEYIGADIREGPGVDVILDLHDIGLPAESVGTVLILDTLEHVEFPRKSIQNLHEILKPHGILIMSSVMNFPIHDYPHDYWRFTPQGFKSLMNHFPFSFVESLGIPEFPHTVVGLAFMEEPPYDKISGFKKQCKAWKYSWNGSPQPFWKRLIKPLIPPIFQSIYTKAKTATATRINRHT